MSTAAFQFPGQALTNGADGFLPTGLVSADNCCPDPLCIPLCDTLCAFVDLLPSGPMWDFQKQAAKRAVGEAANCEPPYGNVCATMASYAIYAGTVLNDMVQTILWPTIRESNPLTAVDTQDDWLDRFGWVDCYKQNCRAIDLAELTPYEYRGNCGPIYCPTEFGDAFDCALKFAILSALVRLQRGFLKNLDGLNWVIEPLGAQVSPVVPYPQEYLDYVSGQCTQDEPPCFCDEVQLQICPTSDTLPGCPSLDSNCGGVNPPVAAAQQYTCGDPPVTVTLYPGVIAAECLVRSILTRKCPNIIYNCPGTVTPFPPIP